MVSRCCSNTYPSAGKKVPASSTGKGQLAHQQERAGGFRFGFRDQHAEQAVDGGDGVGRRKPARIQHGPSRRHRKIFAVRSPAAGDQPLTAAAANESWLCVIRLGNIGCHGDDKGFTTICSSRTKLPVPPIRRILPVRREATVNRTGRDAKPVCERGFDIGRYFSSQRSSNRSRFGTRIVAFLPNSQRC